MSDELMQLKQEIATLKAKNKRLKSLLEAANIPGTALPVAGEIEVEFDVNGEPRKGGVYVAILTAVGGPYNFERKFLEEADGIDAVWLDKHTKQVFGKVKLPIDSIIETGEGGSWKNTYRSYFLVTKDGRKEISIEEAIKELRSQGKVVSAQK